MTTKGAVTIQEVMHETGLSKSGAYDAIAGKKLPGTKIGGRVVILRTQWERFLDAGVWPLPDQPPAPESIREAHKRIRDGRAA